MELTEKDTEAIIQVIPKKLVYLTKKSVRRI